MLEKEKENTWKMENEHYKKKQKNSVFGWLWTKKRFLLQKLAFFRKIGKHYLCSEGKQNTRIFVATICFWKIVLVLWPLQVTKHYKN